MELNFIPLSIAFALPLGVIVIIAPSPRHKSYGEVSSATITITQKGKAMDTNMFRY